MSAPRFPGVRDPDVWQVDVEGDEEPIGAWDTEAEANEHAEVERAHLLAEWRETEGDEEYAGPSVSVTPLWIDDPRLPEARPGSGAALIASERQRQVDWEGWTAEHDDGHTNGILAIAAAELAVEGTDARVENPHERDHCGSLGKHDRVRALTIAGALIAAEIDRELRRLAAKAPQGTEMN